MKKYREIILPLLLFAAAGCEKSEYRITEPRPTLEVTALQDVYIINQPAYLQLKVTQQGYDGEFQLSAVLSEGACELSMQGSDLPTDGTWASMSNTTECTAPQKLDTFGVFFMKYNYEIRLKAVKLVLEGGLSVREAGCHLGCGRSQVHLWVTLFERHGLAGLKLRHGSYSAEFKLSVLKHMHQNHLSLLETAVHFGIPGPFVIRQWERLYQNQGAEGLRRKPQRRRPAMSKSKTKKVKLKTTPHEELLKELEYLRAENAYLKKLQALVEERIVRESGKEPKPSKD